MLDITLGREKHEQAQKLKSLPTMRKDNRFHRWQTWHIVKTHMHDTQHSPNAESSSEEKSNMFALSMSVNASTSLLAELLAITGDRWRRKIFIFII